MPVVDESIFDRKIKIVNANSVLAASTAEGAFALIISQAWNFHQYAINATNAQDGQTVVIYIGERRDGSNKKTVYVRELTEFNKKFTIKK